MADTTNTNNIPVTFAIGTEANINKPENINEGQISLARDTGRLFIDGKNEEGTVKRFGTAGVSKNGGEIFNDYENNFASMKGFRILRQTKEPDENSSYGMYILDSVEGLETGDVFSIRHSLSAIDRGTISDIDEINKIVYVDNYLDEPLITESYATEAGFNSLDEYLKAYPWRNSFSINAKPTIGTIDIGIAAHAEGRNNQALRVGSHAEGSYNTANGEYSHVEGQSNIAGHCAHAEGGGCSATGEYSHAEGRSCYAPGFGAHAEGFQTWANGKHTHVEGYGTASSPNGDFQHVQGKFNEEDPTKAHIIGGGTSIDDKKNIHTVDWEGNAWYAGGVKSNFLEVNGIKIQKGDGGLRIEGNSMYIGGTLAVNASIKANNGDLITSKSVYANGGSVVAKTAVQTPKLTTPLSNPKTLEIEGNLIPSSTSQYTIGTSGSPWQNIYLSNLTLYDSESGKQQTLTYKQITDLLKLINS